ncbi:unnamed protein product [Schistosoma rodhaini]|uniref:HECT-type E3 ubiquitin transferase n=1 Tax=Schistosoma rodhaini TaxID=6188 RepID=A0AA85FRL5_9TREM|nr:unnamed protein product [Schistosoma rodhaini]
MLQEWPLNLNVTLMSIPESQAKHLITIYFNQLIHGCRNVDCQNRNCASSANFVHSGITPNQAAALAIELTINRADLCLSTDAILSSSGMSNPSTSSSVEPEVNRDDNGGETSSEMNEASSYLSQELPSLQTTSVPSSQQLAATSDAITSGPDEDSFHSLMTPAEVTRLIMFLFDASENDEINSSQLNEPASGVNTEDYAADNDNSLTSAFLSRSHLFDVEMVDQQVNSIEIIEKSENNVYWPSVNLNDLRKAWSMIVSIPERQNIVDTLMRAVRRLVVISLHQLLVIQPPDGLDDNQPPTEIAIIQQRLVNLFIILYECPFATDPLHFELLLLNINRAVTWLPNTIQVMLCRAWANSVHTPLANCTESPNPEQTNLWCLQKILLHHITLRCLTTDHGLPNEDKQICEAALVLRIVYYASLLAGQMDSPELLEMEAEENRLFEQQMLTHIGPTYERRSRVSLPEDPFAKALNISPNDCRKPFIPVKDFVNETLNDGLQPKKDYIYYRSKGISNELSFMKLPFLLQTSSKSVLLYYDNRMRMLDERRGVLMHTFLMDTPEMPFFKLRVHRDRIVEDALLILEIAFMENPGDFKKQLLIEFDGEQGIDEGGLSKEFFQLIIERIFNPDYGMFVLDEETQNYWFNPVPLDDMEREYCLIGTLLGLAIYNDVILDVNFPSVLYRKLVGKLGTFEDLFDARPSLAQGLKSLLEYEHDDIENVFGCSFSVNYLDPFGNVVTHELKPDGATVPVTKENRKEYVDLYSSFLLNDSVKKQFNAFRRGFQMVVDESPLTFLFRPDELELLVRGSPVYDFNELERVTTYEEYTSDSAVIKNFWSVVHSMTEEQKKQLLQFSTGSDRVPVGGMSKMKFTIARQGADTNRLPSAHTCFNILLLPEYQSLEKLQQSLLLAITHCKGFGMS